ncbi:MAG: TlpA family protein disulfide reductase [SAR324 cluster bacterium]|nr:TlpA family protein disulfide reductase [SAR324 cluster bacterium]
MKKKILMAVMTLMTLAGFSAGAVPFDESEELSTIRGKTLDLSSLQGKPLVLVFWANWCVPCRKEVSLINNLYEEWYPKNVNFIGINEDEQFEDAVAFVDRYGPQYQSLKDRNFAWAEKMKVNSLPQVIILSSKGTEIFRGFEPPSPGQLKQIIQEET